MSHHSFGRTAFRALTGLDIGLRVRLQRAPAQRAIFAGAESLSLQALASELAQMISSLRVYSYSLRGQLEEVTSALQLNVECGDRRYARRCALDLSSLLNRAAGRGLANRELCVRGAQCALRIAQLCLEAR